MSMPAFGGDPFEEIEPGSWIYLGLTGLISSDLPSVLTLLYPRAGEPLLRFEGAMLVENVLTGLLAATHQEPEIPELATMTKEEISTWVEDLVAKYEAETGRSLSREAEDSLVFLVQEFAGDIPLLSVEKEESQLAKSAITLKAESNSDGLRFVDVDSIPRASEEPRPDFSVRLLAVARRYFANRLVLRFDEMEKPPLLEAVSLEREAVTPPADGVYLVDLGESDNSISKPLQVGWRRLRPELYNLGEELFNPDGTVNLEEMSLYILNSESSLLSGLTLGTVWIAEQSLVLDDSGPTETGQITKSLRGEYRLNPDVAIVGEYTQAVQNSPEPDTYDKTEAKKLGAVVKLGDVELGAEVRNVSSDFSPLLETPDLIPGSSGYELSVKFKDLTFKTLYDKVRAGETEQTGSRTALRLNYSFADRAVLKAGYQFVDVDKVAESDTDTESDTGTLGQQPRSEASLGVDLNIDPNTKVEAGVTFSWDTDESSGTKVFDTKKASAGLEWRLPWDNDLRLRADYEYSQDQTSTKFGVGYSFLDNASLLLGYQLINPNTPESEDSSTEPSPKKGVASAELSISF
ncbi:MAG: hypothetical protein H0Z38_08135 [Firmicutes bacterium]|nr:hypothetical protein [Bacillota bacterium]